MTRNWLIAVLMLVCLNAGAQVLPMGNVAGGAAASTTPVLRHHVQCQLNENRSPYSGYLSSHIVSAIDCPNGLATGAGNFVTLEIQYSSNAGVSGITWSDNIGGNTYSLGPTCTDSTNNQTLSIYYAANIAAGVQTITATFVGGTPINVSMAYQEWYNVPSASVLDGSGNCTATGSNITAGSAISAGSLGMLSYSNDTILYAAVPTAASISSCTAGSGQTDMTWTLMNCDLLSSGGIIQSGPYTTDSALNPKATSGTTTTWLAAAVAIHGIIAGTGPPSGIYVAGVQHNNTATAANPITVQFPCTGNLIVAMGIFDYGPPPYSISSITDSNSNVWNIKGAQARSNGVWDAENATCSGTETLTITFTGTVNGNATIILYDIANAAASPLDSPAGVASVMGTQSSGSSTPITTGTFTPSGAGELELSELSLVYNVITGLNSPSGADFTSDVYAGEPSLTFYDEANGEAAYYTPSSATQTWTWQPNNVDGMPVGGWGWSALAYLAYPGPGIQKIQDTGASQNTTDATTATFGSAVQVGDALIGMGRSGYNACSTGNVPMFTDNGTFGPAGIWQNLLEYNDTTNGQCVTISYALNEVGSPTAVTNTMTADTGGAYNTVSMAEFSGVLTQNATDGTASGATRASGTSWTTPTITTTNPASVIIACLGTVAGQATGLSVAAGTGTATWHFYSSAAANTNRGICAWAIPGVAGTYSAAFSETGTALPAETLIGAFQ